MLPYWLGLLVVAIFVHFSTTSNDSFWDGHPARMLLVIVAAGMGAVLFGVELSSNTLPLLLVQPLSRNRIWWEKMSVFGVALVSASLVMVVRTPWEDGWGWGSGLLVDQWSGVVMLWAVGLSIPLWTLVAGTALGGTVLGLAGPFILSVPVVALIELTMERRGIDFIRIGAVVHTYLSFALPVYALSCFLAAWWRFCHYQATGNGGDLLAGFAARLTRDRLVFLKSGRNPFWNLVRKEVLLHRVSFVMAGLMTGVWFLFLAVLGIFESVRAQITDEVRNGTLIPTPSLDGFGIGLFAGPLAIYAMMIPILVGASAVAEERTLGTHLMNLTLPSLRRGQWVVKCLVAVVVSFVLGLVLPACASMVSSDVRLASSSIPTREFLQLALVLIPIQVLMVMAATWASALCQTTLRSVGLATTMIASLFVWTIISLNIGDFWQQGVVSQAVGEMMVRDGIKATLILLALLSVAGTLILFLALGYRGFRELERRRWEHLAGFGALCVFVLFVSQLAGILMGAFHRLG